ncbi:MAG TPA: signal peptidase I [Polyangiaceae bacterium]|nr:signal peptidase I [Polyangiaceae bacterium]
MSGTLKSLLWFVLFLGGVVGLARAVAIRWWQVPTDDPDLAVSIAPTLNAGDWVLLWRFTTPGVGDLVLCPDPSSPGDIVIGRIAAQGGDTVRIQGGDVIINRRRLGTETSCDPSKVKVVAPGSSTPIELGCQIEILGGGTHMRLSTPRKDTDFSAEVPLGEVFLLSDDRHLPFDSRDYGTLPASNCKEQFFFRLMGDEGFWGDEGHRLTFIN